MSVFELIAVTIETRDHCSELFAVASYFRVSMEKGQPLPKFGEWDVNDPASAEGFTVIFNKARDEKKTGGKPESPARVDPPTRPSMNHHKPPSRKGFCCFQSPSAES